MFVDWQEFINTINAFLIVIFTRTWVTGIYLKNDANEFVM